MATKKVILIGIGNPYLQDDRAGLEVVSRLRELGCPWDLEELYTTGLELLDKIKGYDEVIIVDAAQWGKEPGTIIELSGEELRLPHVSSVNTHAMTLGHIIELGYVAFPDEMPKKFTAYLIEAEHLDEFSQVMSPRIEEAIEKLVKLFTEIWKSSL
ncbi:hydrogenase maturation protease [Thermodesulfatator indicus DSM 15286]|uniref:Hydrogenase maturation protease n=1 Tax=Thermodesulfatator indicus (strain DSM 15286 / JCM 11887 / CIR29812) TaxID=667014 RepID=F8ABN9_THEID|nr:hydrogenase maturation protease [Thermodesulfatator indicus]AEH45641.1 hydrogenase maturation protease [Thermodesulfatator indicus DSM 15286]